MAIYNIDKNDKTPYFRQLVKQTIHLINEGVLDEGFQLPSSRVLAEELDINRSTVFKAYRELWGLGYIDSSPGSYSIVRKRGEIANKTNKIPDSLIDWDKTTIQIPNVHFHNRRNSKEIINFCPLSPDPRITPTDDFRKCMNDVLREKGDSLLQYGDPAGYPPLREYISGYLSHHRICSTVDEIMITEGAQSALELITKLFAQKKWSVIVEKPTYSAAIPLFRLYGGEILEIPVNEGGMDLDILEENLKTNQPSFIYTMSNYQNPTGYTSTQKNREKLLSICEEHSLPLIEDGFTEDMRGTTLPIKSMDSSGIVIYIGTFSKVLFPGIRTGWINGDKKCIEKLTSLQYISRISGNIPVQAAIDRFCRFGLYDNHIKRIYKIYKKRMKKALQVLRENLRTEIASFTIPSGGYIIWICLKDNSIDEKTIIGKLEEASVAVTGGSASFAGKPENTNIRLSIAHLDESEIEKGIIILASVLNKIYKR